MRLHKMALAALAVTGAGLTPSMAQAQSTTDIIETVGAMILADRLGIDPNMILGTQMNTGSSVFDLAPALTMGSYGQADPLQVLAMQNMGLGWNDIARIGRVPDPVYSSLVNNRQLDSNAIWADELGSRYSMSEAYLQELHNAGYSWREIARASVMSQETGRSIEDILYESRLDSNSYYQSSYRNGEPLYLPPRTSSRYASLLPPPRRDWEFAGDPFTSNQTVWVDEFQPVRYVRRPVVTRWSSQRIVRQPMLVRLGNSHNYRLMGQPANFRVNGNKRFFAQTNRPRTAPQTIIIQQPTIYVNNANRWVLRDTGDRRAQRFVTVQNQRQIAEREREQRLRELRLAANDRRQDAVQDLRQRTLEQKRLEEARQRRLEQQRREMRNDARDQRKDAISDQRKRELALQRTQEARQRRLEQQRREMRNDSRDQRKDAISDQRKRELALQRTQEARQRRLEQQRREMRNDTRVQRKDAISDQRKRELAQKRTEEARERRLDQQRREMRNDSRVQRKDAVSDQRKREVALQRTQEARQRRLDQQRREMRNDNRQQQVERANANAQARARQEKKRKNQGGG